MKLHELSIDGFGVWSGLEIGPLSDELTVFYGANEAGKTTVMQFLRTMFFGFSPERRARYLPPLHGGRPGGSVRLALDDADCSITRHADPNGEADLLVVARGTRQALDSQQALQAILSDVDEPTFTNVFVCGLREVQELATLADTQAAEELYNLALGVDRVSLADALRELNASRERLLAGDDRPSLVVQLLSQRERLEGEIDELSGAAVRFLALRSDQRRLDAEIEALESETARLDEQARDLAVARALAERWQRRDALDDRLQALVGTGTLAPDALARFEQLGKNIAIFGRRLRKLKRRRLHWQSQIDALKINEPLVRQALRLEALAEQQHWIAALERKALLVQEDISRLDQQVAGEREQWGATGAALSRRAYDELRQAAGQVRAARSEVRAYEESTAAAKTSSASAERRIEEALGAAKGKGLTAALADAGQLVADLRRRVHLDERLNQLAARETELEAQSQEQLANQLLPAWALIGLGSMFVLGCALVLLFLVGLVLPSSLGDSLSWPVGLVGVAAAASAGAFKFFMERGAESRLDRCHQQLSVLGQQIQEARSERDELDARLPRGGGPLVSRLQAAEKSLAQLEALLPLQSERDVEQRQAAAAAQQAEALHRRAQEARRRWRRLLDENGLPADFSPQQLKALARGRRQLAGVDAELADKRAELGRVRTEYETLISRIGLLVGQAGVPLKGERPLDHLQQCLAELAEQQLLAGQRDELTAKVVQLRRRYLKAQRQRRRLRQRRLLLLRSAGTQDEAEFRRLAAHEAEAARLAAERSQVDREITAALAVPGKDRIAAWLAGREHLERLQEEAAESRRLTLARLGAANQRRGELAHQIKLMADDRRLGEKRLELELVKTRLADAIDRWRVLAVASLVLEAVRAYYEREHQPLALREASGYLKRLTAGRYARVWTPLGEGVLRVDDAEGASLSVEVLSSGTREQLFLALRLALAGAYARRGVRLPLVLDDVLVNFDVDRSQAAATVLRDFARQGHQVLVFTCHEHLARMFRGLKAAVRNLPDHTRDNAAVAAVAQPEGVLPAVEIEPPWAEPVAIEPPPIERVIEAAVVAEPPPVEKPKPKPKLPPPAPPKPRRRLVHRTQRVRWDAEEFEGELSDRVRRDVWIEEPAEGAGGDDPDALDDTQAA